MWFLGFWGFGFGLWLEVGFLLVVWLRGGIGGGVLGEVGVAFSGIGEIGVLGMGMDREGLGLGLWEAIDQKQNLSQICN